MTVISPVSQPLGGGWWLRKGLLQNKLLHVYYILYILRDVAILLSYTSLLGERMIHHSSLSLLTSHQARVQTEVHICSETYKQAPNKSCSALKPPSSWPALRVLTNYNELAVPQAVVTSWSIGHTDVYLLLCSLFGPPHLLVHLWLSSYQRDLQIPRWDKLLAIVIMLFFILIVYL